MVALPGQAFLRQPVHALLVGGRHPSGGGGGERPDSVRTRGGEAGEACICLCGGEAGEAFIFFLILRGLQSESSLSEAFICFVFNTNAVASW